MLDVRGLTKKFRNRAAVDRVTFTVPPGQVTGYLGPNGSGNSTTVKMLTVPLAGDHAIPGKDSSPTTKWAAFDQCGPMP